MTDINTDGIMGASDVSKREKLIADADWTLILYTDNYITNMDHERAMIFDVAKKKNEENTFFVCTERWSQLQ